MKAKRRRYSARFKSEVAIEAIKERKTLSELSGEYSVHPNQIGLWKKELLREADQIFSNNRQRKEKEREHLEQELYSQIGQLKVELDWLKKKLPVKNG